MPLNLKEGAIFIADAHYPRNKKELLALFDFLILSPPPQCFLLGDIFEFACPKLPYSLAYNEELIVKIKALSLETELFYLEGNHDYLLKELFLNAKVYSMQEQPLIVAYHNGKAAIFHGDKHGDFLYALYSKLIRSPFVISILRVVTLDINGRFIKSLYKKLLVKNICGEFAGFAERKKTALKKYDSHGANLIIEGHSHQRVSLDVNGLKYEALEAFACTKSFFKVKFEHNDIRFVKMSLGALKDGQA